MSDPAHPHCPKELEPLKVVEWDPLYGGLRYRSLLQALSSNLNRARKGGHDPRPIPIHITPDEAAAQNFMRDLKREFKATRENNGPTSHHPV